MAIDHDSFYQWAVNQFGESNVKIRYTAHGTEICTHSPWSLAKIGKDDRKYKLWMNTTVGDYGVYRDWLTDTKGSLVELVSKFDGMPFDEVEELISDATSLRALEKKVNEYFEELYGIPEEDEPEEPKAKVALPENCFRLRDMSPDNPWFIRASDYLSNRKLPVGDLYVCSEDEKFGDRIIVPYYNREGELIFFNGRALNPKQEMRYRKCEGVPLDEVLYMTGWPRSGKIYVMEGEFDAMSMELAGFVSCACGGKFLSTSQMEMLRGYEIVLSFDADSSGLEAMIQTGMDLIGSGFKVRYVRPPKLCKDWNALLTLKGPQVLRQYVEKYEKPYTQDTALRLKMSA